jgi:hypothetical protein
MDRKKCPSVQEKLPNRKDQRDLALLMVLPTLAFAGFAAYHFDGSFPVAPDSLSYMYFGADRPVGYPLFLSLVKLVFGSFAAAPYVQLGVLCLALGGMAWSVRLQAGSIWWGFALEILLFVNPGLLLLADWILSDSLSASCVALFAAIIILMTDRPRPWAIWALVAVTAVSTTIRPVNIALVPAAAIAILVFERSMRLPRWGQITILILGVVVAHAVTPAVHWLRHEPLTSGSPLARGLLGKTLFRQWPADAEANLCDGDLISKATEAANAYLAETPPDIRSYLIPQYSDYLRFRVILPEMATIHQTTQLDSVMMCYAIVRIKSDPLFFMQNAALQFFGFIDLSYVHVSKQAQSDQAVP